MNLLEPFLALTTIVVAVVSLIAIILPIARLGLGTRKRALFALALSFVGFVAVGALVPDASQERHSSKLEPAPATTEELPEKKTQSDADDNASPSVLASDPIYQMREQQIATDEPNSLASVNESAERVQYHNFSIKISEEEKTGIWLTVDTTLPAHVDIRVSIGRAIVTIKDKKIVTDSGIIVEQKKEKSWFLYFSEREQLEQWKTPRFIRIDDLKWLQDLKKNLNEKSVVGVPYKVAAITDDIEISAYTYRNKIGKPYEKREFKSQSDRYLNTRWDKKSEIQLSRAWTGPQVTVLEPSIVNAYYLEVNKTYQLIKDKIPITEFRRAADYENIDKALEGIRYLPAGTLIRVLGVVGHKETRPYYPSPHYRVSLPEYSDVQGWILSIALSPDGVKVATQ